MARGSARKYHGMNYANAKRPKSALHKRRNKAKARARKQAAFTARKD